MRVCIDIRDPRQESPGAAPRDMRSSQDTSRPPKLRLAVPVERKWSNGREVAVAFLDAHADLHQRVMAVADSWTEHANLTFEWDVPLTEADVRVTFAGAGSWSQVGTDARLVPKTEPTLCLGWITGGTNDEVVRQTVLHESGTRLAPFTNTRALRAGSRGIARPFTASMPDLPTRGTRPTSIRTSSPATTGR